ncbi:MAG: peptide deformylase [Endomicrobium sp.]|jgi:peptide deformylase|nr:peptide deformylase [Endomicrobium sp.]
MAILKIKKYDDSVLREKAKIVLKVDDDVKKLAYDMLETMYLALGVGLAAPQVGVSVRLCVIDVNLSKKSPIIMVNPIIISCDVKKIFEREGCLSFPGFYENVKRYEKVVVRYTDLNSEEREIETRDLLSRAIQHEVDHLDAKLFIDYLPKWKRRFVEKKAKKNRNVNNW